MTEKVADSFLTAVDPAKTKVVASPGYIAIFGGAISPRKSRSKNPRSKRDAFLRWTRANRGELEDRLILPENYDDWNDFGTYSDLLLFEKDLALLTNAILIFLEAPGAIAELGAFSQIDVLSQRLVVVVTADHHPKKSFISLGPIRSLAETQKRRSSICVIPPVALANLAPHMPVVMETLDSKRRPTSTTTTFNKEEPQHQILLVLDLLNLFTVTTIKEVQRLARHFGVALSIERLNQFLFVLKKTGLVAAHQYGTVEYFVATKADEAFVDFTAKTGSDAFSRVRLKAKRWEEISGEYNRHAAYLLAKKEGE